MTRQLPRRVSKLSQFRALLHKNVLLQTRNRKSPLGGKLGGWGAFLFQLCLPAFFFLVMWLPKYYIPPVPHLQQLSSRSLELDTAWWSGPQPYSGPALDPQFQGAAHILLAPDTPAVTALAPVLARALACAPDPSKYACLPGRPTNFYCLFSNTTSMPDQCKTQATCMADETCYRHLLEPQHGHPPQIGIMRDEAAAVDRAMQRPAEIDAVLVFDNARRSEGGVGSRGHTAQSSSNVDAGDSKNLGQMVETGWASAQTAGRTAATANDPPLLAHSLLDYRIRINHTDIPPTEFLYDMFDVVPDPFRNNGLMLYKLHWFFTNLQLALERSIIGLRRSELWSPPPRSPAPSPSPDPTPTLSPSPAPAPDPSSGPPSSHQQMLDHEDVKPGNLGSLAGVPTEASTDGSKIAGGGSSAYPADVRVSFKPFPWPAVTEDLGAVSAGVLFNLLLVFAFLAPARAVVGSIVREKELRLREGMRIMGLGEVGYWGSWFLTHWVSLLVSGILCSLVGTYPFSHTSVAVMILFFSLFTASLIFFSYFMSTLFSTSRVAGTAAQLLYAISMLPGFLAPALAPYGGPALYWACLTPPSAASLFAGCLINWELVSQGINWNTLWLPVTPNSSWSAGSVLLLLALDVLIYAFLAWYCDKVLPTGHGHTLPPFFFLDKKYWVPPDEKRDSASASNKPTSEHRIGIPVDGSGNAGETVSLLHSDGMACATVRARGAVSVQRLRKEFYTTQGDIKVALDDVDVDFSGGRITALLGHNGAGKTTLIHILTGLTSPTSGNAILNGFDARREMGRIRESLGVCPQHDVLWPDLTVREHLQLYAAIKGYRGADVAQVAVEAGEQVGLAAKLDSQAGDLSGGQKRKLSVAIAFLGDPAVVLIDEPTSGMDPYTRRFTWELIRSYRGRAAVVLTTHSMEEADVLGDDVVIMCAGRVAAHGTPMELKAAHGEGYTLTLSLCSPPPPPTPSNSFNQLQTAAATGTPQAQLQQLQAVLGGSASGGAGRMEALEALVQRHVPGAQLVRCTGCGRTGNDSSAVAATSRGSGEMVFQLPRFDAPLFPPLLRALDAAVAATNSAAGAGRLATSVGLRAGELAGLGVSSYGLSVTTLEEVFLKVTEETTDYGVRGEAEAEMSSVRGGRDYGTHAEAAGAGGDDSAGAHRRGEEEGEEDSEGQHQSQGLLPHKGDPKQHHGAHTSSALPGAMERQQDETLTEPVQGWALLQQQMRAQLTKRALCAARGRLTLLTQLVVPLLLVYLSLWVTSLSVKSADKPAVALTRQHVLEGQPCVLSAAPDVRGAPDGRLSAWMRAFEPVYDSGLSKLYQGGSLDGTLDGWLLSHWNGEPRRPKQAELAAAKSGISEPELSISSEAASMRQSGRSPRALHALHTSHPTDAATAETSDASNVAHMVSADLAGTGGRTTGTEAASAESAATAYTNTGGAPRSITGVRSSMVARSSVEVQSRNHAPLPAYDAMHVTALPSLQDWLHGETASSTTTSSSSAPSSSGSISTSSSTTTSSSSNPSSAGSIGASSSTASSESGTHADSKGASSVLRASSSSSSSSNGGATAQLTLLVNQTAVWGMPAAISSASTGLLRYLEEAASTGPPETQEEGAEMGAGAAFGGHPHSQGPFFKATNHPLPIVPTEATARVRQDASALLLVVCLTLAASVLSASFCVFLVRERASGSTHLQLVAGTPSWLYWTSTLGWDLVQYSISATGILLLVVWYDLPQYSGPRLPAVVALLAGLGVSSLPLTYLMQRSFTDEMKALQRLNTLFFLVGYLGFVAVWIMDLILIFTQPITLQRANSLIKTTFRLLSPHFCFAKGVFDVSQTYTSTMPLPIPHETDPWAYNVTGSPLMHMAMQTVVYFGLVVLLDSGLTTWARTLVSQRLMAAMHHRTKTVSAPGGHSHGRDRALVGSGQEGHTLAQPLLGLERNADSGAVGADGFAGGVGVAGAGNGTLSAAAGSHQHTDEVDGDDCELDEDEDVREERLAVQQGACDASGAVVVVDGARKTYFMGTAGWKATVAGMVMRLLRRAGVFGGGRGSPAASGDARTAASDGAGGAGGDRAQSAGGRATELSAGGSGSWALDVREPQDRSGYGGGADGNFARRQEEGPGLEHGQLAAQQGGRTEGGSGGEDVVRALKGLWVHVMPGECFGLLGVNGAGKSTTFKILTGEILPDAGDARIAGHSILLALQQARQRLGYCPQADALPGDMTGREVLAMYARLRGVHESQVGATVEVLLQQLGFDVGHKAIPWKRVRGIMRGAAAAVHKGGNLLSRMHGRSPAKGRDGSSSRVGHDTGSENEEGGVGGGSESDGGACNDVAASGTGGGGSRGGRAGGGKRRKKGTVGLTSADTACGYYSGGSRRKLALAVALVGEPRVALLDEPSTGLDPGARRAMWSTLQGPHVLKAGRGVVLTSHSMEECEALCGRLAIMAHGQARCIGSVQHLKSRFGGGYMLEARLLPLPPKESEATFRGAGGTSSSARAIANTDADGPEGSPSTTAAATAGMDSALTDARACNLVQRVTSVCPGVRVVESDGTRLEVAIPRDSGSLADLFEVMDAASGPCQVASYALSQCTLEHVFVRLAGGETTAK